MTELWVLLRVLVSLVVVLGVAVLALRFVLPRLLRLPGLGTAPGRRLQIVETLPLDRQHRLAVVRCGERELLLGLGGGTVTTLDSWPSPPGLAAIPGGSGSEAEARAPALRAVDGGGGK